jgi:hypothetical protein
MLAPTVWRLASGFEDHLSCSDALLKFSALRDFSIAYKSVSLDRSERNGRALNAEL